MTDAREQDSVELEVMSLRRRPLDQLGSGSGCAQPRHRVPDAADLGSASRQDGIEHRGLSMFRSHQHGRNLPGPCRVLLVGLGGQAFAQRATDRRQGGRRRIEVVVAKPGHDRVGAENPLGGA
jgi:hypothetical protein